MFVPYLAFLFCSEVNMNLLDEKNKKVYFKYLLAAFGSAMISCIYGVVDMAVVGQYQGPNGTAALAIVAPIWNIIYSFGLFMGVGGSVIFSIYRGKNSEDVTLEKQYFSIAVKGSIILSLFSWLAIIFFEEPILTFLVHTTLPF